MIVRWPTAPASRLPDTAPTSTRWRGALVVLLFGERPFDPDRTAARSHGPRLVGRRSPRWPRVGRRRANGRSRRRTWVRHSMTWAATIPAARRSQSSSAHPSSWSNGPRVRAASATRPVRTGPSPTAATIGAAPGRRSPRALRRGGRRAVPRCRGWRSARRHCAPRPARGCRHRRRPRCALPAVRARGRPPRTPGRIRSG